jgi:uncharacterized protein
MRHPRYLIALLLGGAALACAAAAPVKPLRALYVTGGCCHDYDRQKVIIPQGLTNLINVEWTVVQEGGTGTGHDDIAKSIFQNPDWAKGYDVVVHNECFADDADPAYIEKFLAPHRAGLPAVVLHCQMHTFRALKTDVYREFLGVSSFGHGPSHPLEIKVLKADHPVMKGFPDGLKTVNEELYHIAKLWPDSTPLAQARETDGKDHVLIWVNTHGAGRVFGTTLAHDNRTMADPNFLALLSRGLLWACGQLDESGLAKPGYEAPARK